MSREALEQVIGKMVLDGQFRQAVKDDPQAALAESGLEAAEIEQLKDFADDDFENAVSGLDQRISKRHKFR